MSNINRLSKIGENLSDVALIKLQSNKLLIERMSNNLILHNQGITDIPDELEIQAPEIVKPIVRLKRI